MKQLEFNPWLNIWVHPRNTIQKITEIDANYQLAILSFLYGFPWVLSIAQTLSLGKIYSALLIVIGSAILAIPSGYILLTIAGFAFFLIGKIIGGKGSFKQVRSALAWANVPNSISIIIWLILISYFRQEFFQQNFAREISEISVLTASLFIQCFFGVWAFILFLHTLGQVQKFSSWMALLNVTLVIILYVLGVLGISSIMNYKK